MWSDKHYWTEVYRYGLERMLRIMTQDRFLSNFASAWRGLPHDEHGISGSEPPKWWTDAYMKLQKKEDAPGTATLENSGATVQIDPDTGNVWLRNQAGYIGIAKQDIPALIQFLQTPKPRAKPPTGQGVANPGQTDNRVLAERMQRNLKAMEDWAKASSKAYPKSK